MNIGTSQIDITPAPGVELSGFGCREQPSTGVLDPLWCRALYLQDGPEQLLWIHADLVGVERPLVEYLRRWAEQELGVARSRVMLSATHTHSGPATIHLTGCGRYDAQYVGWLLERLKEAARRATADTEPCRTVAVEGRLELGVDRRGQNSTHADPRVGAVGWRRDDGTFKAVLLNYAMHPVCFDGRLISADWPGQTAAALSESLPGKPTALVCVGACGNINPPAVGVPPEQVRQWGTQLADGVIDKLQHAPANGMTDATSPLGIIATTVQLPLDVWTVGQINDYANRCLGDQLGHDTFGGSYRQAIEHWRTSMTELASHGGHEHAEVELFGVALAGVVLLGVNAEIFSRFTEIVCTHTDHHVYTVSCANGSIGYVPSQEAYEEGGYEVEHAMLFGNRFRPKRGGLELLAERACRLVTALADGQTGVQSHRLDRTPHQLTSPIKNAGAQEISAAVHEGEPPC